MKMEEHLQSLHERGLLDDPSALILTIVCVGWVEQLNSYCQFVEYSFGI